MIRTEREHQQAQAVARWIEGCHYFAGKTWPLCLDLAHQNFQKHTGHGMSSAIFCGLLKAFDVPAGSALLVGDFNVVCDNTTHREPDPERYIFART